jgi:hypothetical protein
MIIRDLDRFGAVGRPAEAGAPLPVLHESMLTATIVL